MIDRSDFSQIGSATSPAEQHLVHYLQRINANELPQLTRLSPTLDRLEVGSGLVTVIGAPPGYGKTALSMQIMFDAIAQDASLRAVVANAETTFDGLLRRELTRVTRIDSNKIRFGFLDAPERAEITEAASNLMPQLQRVSVLSDPNTLMQLMRLRSEPPGLVIVDYSRSLRHTIGTPGKELAT
jgi:replicative DNA helicase